MKNKRKNPPFIPSVLLNILLRGEDFYEFTDDIDEVYQYRMDSEPGWKTKAWYWFRVLESLPVRQADLTASALLQGTRSEGPQLRTLCLASAATSTCE